MLLASVDLVSLPAALVPAFLLAIAALTAAALSSSVNSFAGSSVVFGYSWAALAFFFSFFFLFFEFPSPTFGACAYFDSSLAASFGTTPSIKASNSASSLAFCSFLLSFLTVMTIKIRN